MFEYFLVNRRVPKVSGEPKIQKKSAKKSLWTFTSNIKFRLAPDLKTGEIIRTPSLR